MAVNELVVGEPRLGWFVDGHPDTAEVAVMLRDTGTVVELTIPLRGMITTGDPYGRWWMHNMLFSNDPERYKLGTSPPRVLLLYDSAGPVVLVGCRTAGSTANLNAGQGTIIANFAVLGGRSLKYDRINGLRTDVPALAAWTRLSNMELDVDRSDRNRVQSVQMTLTNAEAVSLARPMNLMMRSTWRTEQPFGGFRAYEGVRLETTVRKARSWDEHLDIHSSVLELVSIAAWRPFGFSEIEVQRTDDGRMSPGGETLDERWSRVATHRLPKHVAWSRAPQFLFPFNEVGPRGIARWLRLRKVYGRVLGPLQEILRSDNPWSESSAVQSGIALEALGYVIDVEKNDRANLNRRNQMTFKAGLQVILDDMAVEPFDDTEGWVERAHGVYMGLKHLDRDVPDTLVMLNSLRENLLVVRFWLGLELGVDPKKLMGLLPKDPLADELAWVD